MKGILEERGKRKKGITTENAEKVVSQGARLCRQLAMKKKGKDCGNVPNSASKYFIIAEVFGKSCS